VGRQGITDCDGDRRGLELPSAELGCAVHVEDERLSVVWADGMWRERPGGGDLVSPIRFIILERAMSLSGTFVEIALPAIVSERMTLLVVAALTTETVIGTDSCSVGVAGDPMQLAASLGVAPGSSSFAVLYPSAFNPATPIRVSAAGGEFLAGKVLLSCHALVLPPPIS
jgi:hypothetical protein